MFFYALRGQVVIIIQYIGEPHWASTSEQNRHLFVTLKTNHNGEYIFFSQKCIQAF